VCLTNKNKESIVHKSHSALTWIFIAVAVVVLILGAIFRIAGDNVVFSLRGCILLSGVFLLFAINFSLLRIIRLREEGK